MGRPLKIAKAQAVLTVTNTTATTNIVTVSEDLRAPSDSVPAGLGIIAGMSFVPSVTTGTNLIAGTTYWVLAVTGTHTFTVSATQLSANPTRTAVTLTTGTTASALTVNGVDTGFNNPAGTGNTYSVVGGNTSIYGKQVLANVAIGVDGTGTIYTNTSIDVVSGIGTDLSNAVAVGSWIGTTATTALGYVASLGGLITVTTASSAAATDRITVDDSSSLVLNGAIVFADAIGGLSANTIYYVKALPSGTTLQVSLTPGGALIQLSDDTVTTTGTQDTVTLVASSAANASGSSYVYATGEAGYIVRQKGKQKYLVKGATTGLVGACYTANVANTALTPNTMTITATYANAATVKVQSLSDHTAELFTATSGPVATGNIVLANASPAFDTFNTAYAANTYGGQPYPIVTITNS